MPSFSILIRQQQPAAPPAPGETKSTPRQHARRVRKDERLRGFNQLVAPDHDDREVLRIKANVPTCAVSEQTGAASIRTLAPGVSAALMTTIAGLVVANPSMFGSNFLLGQVKQLTTEIENYASSLADRLELESKN